MSIDRLIEEVYGIAQIAKGEGALGDLVYKRLDAAIKAYEAAKDSEQPKDITFTRPYLSGDEYLPNVKISEQPDRMMIFKSMTGEELDAITWDDRSQDKPLIMQLRDNLSEWADIAKDRQKSIDKFVAERNGRSNKQPVDSSVEEKIMAQEHKWHDPDILSDIDHLLAGRPGGKENRDDVLRSIHLRLVRLYENYDLLMGWVERAKATKQESVVDPLQHGYATKSGNEENE